MLRRRIQLLIFLAKNQKLFIDAIIVQKINKTMSFAIYFNKINSIDFKIYYKHIIEIIKLIQRSYFLQL